jgi:DNA helicase-2/ATP-dependent DNA helicase PcrA
VLPESCRTVESDGNIADGPELELMELDWRARHLVAMADSSLQGLLSERLERYQISPTHVTDFIDLEYAGPQHFYFKTLLRFPQTPIPDAKFGNAIHQTMEWLQHRVSERGGAPSTQEVLQQFRARLASQRLSPERSRLEMERGEHAMVQWLKERSHTIRPTDVAERSFRNDGIFIDEAHLSGQIDRLEIDKENKRITIIDYKTGKAYSSWKSDAKLHRYRLQLYLYKLLVEGSPAFRDYTVDKGRLEFIEPDDHGKLHQLELAYTDNEQQEALALLRAVWTHVKALSFPDITGYEPTLTGIKSFEKDLIEGTI